VSAFELGYSPATVLFEKTLERALPAMMAVPGKDIIDVNLFIADAMTTVLGVEPVLLS
jgi:hypothetical protein